MGDSHLVIRKSTLYTAAKFGWALLVAGTVIVLFSGQAESVVSASQLPQDPFVMFGVAAGSVLVGWLVIGRHETRSWLAAGRQANLTPEGGGGLLGKPDLTGTINGRPVRARTVKRKKGQGSRDTSSKQTFTVVEADLDSPAEEGLIVTPASGGRTSATRASIEIDPERADVKDDRLAVAGGSEAVAQEVISGRSRSALLDMDGFDLVYVGNASEAVSEMIPDVSDSRLGSWFEGKITDRVPGDPSTVSTETMGMVHDGDRLRRQVEAVAAVADAFERA